MTPDKDGYLSHRQILVVLTGLLIGMFIAALDQSIVNTALPRITSELGGLDKLSWVVTAYLLTSTASTPLWGKVSDIYGRRPLFLTAIIVFVAGSLLAGLAQTMTQLIAFRAVQGLGGGGLMALGLATIGDIVPPRERARYQGYMAVTFGTSSVLGPVLGGFFADGPGWRWIFFINVPLGLVALVVTSAALKIRHERRDHSIDYLGAAVIVASVSLILLYTAWAGPDRGWTDQFSLGLLAAGLLLAVAFVFIELHAKEPIIPMGLFRNSTFAVATSFSFLVGLTMFGTIVFIPLYLQVVTGLSPTQSGLAATPMVAGLMTSSSINGRYMSRTGHYRFLPAIGSGFVIVGLLMLAQLDVGTPLWFCMLAMFVFGFGFGFTSQVVVVAVQNALGREHIGVGTSSVMFFRQMGGSFGTALCGAVLTSQLASRASAAGGSGLDKSSFDDVAAIRALPDAARLAAEKIFSASLQDVFVTALPFAIAGLVVALLFKEVPLALRQSDSEAADEALEPDAVVVHS